MFQALSCFGFGDTTPVKVLVNNHNIFREELHVNMDTPRHTDLIFGKVEFSLVRTELLLLRTSG